MTQRPLWQLLALAAIAFSLLAASVQAKPLTLTERDRALFEIVLPPNASAPERFAAKELQDAIQLATGAEPATVEAGAASKLPVKVFLGTPENQPQIAKIGLKPSSEDDEIIIHTKGNALYLGGSNARSVLYSAYRFLEEAFGFRWLWPGDTGVFFEQRRDRSVIEPFNLREKAGLRLRSLSINSPHYEEHTLLWMARNRMNVYNAPWNIKPHAIKNLHEKGFIIRFAGHNLHLPREVLEANPEFVAEYGGSRTLFPRRAPHLCWSNPKVQQALVEHIGEKIRNLDGIDVWSIYPVDATNFCQCQGCIEMAEDTSTRYQKLCTILIKELKKIRSDLKFDMLAYQSYRNVPKLLAPFDQIYYTSYNISYRHPLDSGASSNNTAIKELKRWQALGAKVGLRNYEMIPFNEKLFVPLVSYEVAQSSYARENGLVYYSTEVTPYGYPKQVADTPEKQNWVTNRMNLYALAAALWDRDATTETIVNDWTRTIYGPDAAKPMADYYHAMEKAWMAAPGEVSYFGVPPTPHALGMISQPLIEEAKTAFSQARALLKEEKDDAFRQRALGQVALEHTMFNAWEQLYRNGSEDAEHLSTSAVRTEASHAEIMNPENVCWKQSIPFPAFRAAHSRKLKDQTDISALWKDGSLYLRVTCHDSAPAPRQAKFRIHDDPVHQDDSIEIFFNKPETSGYYHLAFNSLGTRYDAFSEGGMNLDGSVNPKWEVSVTEGANGWTAVVALPLAEFGHTGENPKSVALSVKRTRPRTLGGEYPKSGWPDAAYHSAVNAGTILLVEHRPGKVMIHGSGRMDARKTTLASSFREKGWGVCMMEDQPELPAPSQDDFLYLRHNSSKGSTPLPYPYITSVLYPWLSEGGRMLIACSHGLHLDKWFPGAELSVQWAGWGAPERRSNWYAEGEWMRAPNDLSRILRSRTTPASAYRPTSGRWEVLATQAMRKGGSAAFLMHSRVGKGHLFVTSSNMAYGGGHEMFGDLNPRNAVKLIENLHRLTRLSSNENTPY